MRTLLLLMFSLFFTFTSLAQGSFTIESQNEEYEVIRIDSIFQKAALVIEELSEGLKNEQTQYEIQFFKKINGKRGFEELKMMQLSEDKKVKLIVIKKFGEAQPRRYTFDATQFYNALQTKIESLESKHYIQNFPEGFVDTNERNSILWRVRKEKEVIASVFSLDIPSISFKDDDENYPPSEWNILVNLDINKLNNISIKDKKNKKRRNKSGK